MPRSNPNQAFDYDKIPLFVFSWLAVSPSLLISDMMCVYSSPSRRLPAEAQHTLGTHYNSTTQPRPPGALLWSHTICPAITDTLDLLNLELLSDVSI